MKKLLKKKTLFAVLLAVVLFLALGSYLVISDTSYCEYIYEGDNPIYTDAKVTYSTDGIVEDCAPVHGNGYFKLQFNSLKKGSTSATIVLYTDGNESMRMFAEYHVGIFNILYKRVNGLLPDIDGYPAVYITISLYFIIMGVYMIFNFKDSLKKSMYSYKTVFNCSLMILLCGFGIMFSLFSAYLLSHYREYQISGMRNITTVFILLIIMLSLIFVFIYSCSMTASDISLIIHEGFRVQNALGIIISVCLTIGVLACAAFPFLYMYFDSIVFNILYSVVSTIFIFIEIFLISTKACALIATKHKPKYDKDYIIILGCGIKEDGTLLQLLRGRVDKAIEFYKAQLENTGKKAVFVPSGGQGGDEIISEGEAMKRYLLEQGIPEDQIMPETKPTNTLENMKFSKELINNENAKGSLFHNKLSCVQRRNVCKSGQYEYQGYGQSYKMVFLP